MNPRFGPIGSDGFAITPFSDPAGPPPPAASGPSGWGGMLAGGVLFFIISIVQFAIIGFISSDSRFQDDSGFMDGAIVIPIATLTIALVLIMVAIARRNTDIEQAEAGRRALEEQRMEQARQRELERQEMVKAIKSTIMIRCRYCGTLNEESAQKCISCGANL